MQSWSGVFTKAISSKPISHAGFFKWIYWLQVKMNICCKWNLVEESQQCLFVYKVSHTHLSRVVCKGRNVGNYFQIFPLLSISMDGDRYEVPPLAEEPLAIDHWWGRKSQFPERCLLGYVVHAPVDGTTPKTIWVEQTGLDRWGERKRGRERPRSWVGREKGVNLGRVWERE